MIKLYARNHIIDFLKGISIISVILYHLGVSEFGYLGVDVFFVISGYFVALGLTKNFSQGKFSYLSFFNKRLSRLWPGLILISAISLGLGYYFMLPLHYKLNCESVIGTITFTNNFVQYITSGGYWIPDNEFKPLMHTWYIGILMQFYIIVPIIFIMAKRCFTQWKNVVFYILTGFSLLSLIGYLSPFWTETQNFYLLPSRFFELGSGALLALVITNKDAYSTKGGSKTFLFSISLILTCVFIFSSGIDAMKLRLTFVVAITILMVACSHYISVPLKVQKCILPLTFLGVASYSLYLSHQVFFAFYRYIINSSFNLTTYLWIITATIAIGILIYFLFEKPLSQYISRGKKNIYRLNVISLVLAMATSAIGYYYYHKNGLMRDIPELDLYLGANNQTPEEYNSYPFRLNSDFENNERENILVIGDSFGRDWVNILREAGIDSVYNISYSMVDVNTRKRIKDADYIFVATNRPFFESYNYDEIYPELFSKEFWRVGMKRFCNRFIGNTYCKRDSPDYYGNTGDRDAYIQKINLYEKSIFKNRFIDVMAPVTAQDSSIILFTEDQKLITQDGLHLTKAGAKMYAEKLNVWQYFK